jgi:ABC-type lipoprotein export system ATPase subunit
VKDLIHFTNYARASEQWWLNHQGVTIFIGENGAGKSRLLALIETQAAHARRKPVAIANTPYDKFRARIKGARRLLVRRGASAPEQTLKLAIASAERDDQIALRRVSRVLRHCGYLPDVGIRAEVTANVRRRFRDLGLLEQVAATDRDEVRAICSVLLRPDFPLGTIWFDFDSDFPDYSYRSIIPKVIRWESVLRQLRIVKRVHLSLRNSEAEIPLTSASSGELSLITTMAYLTTLPSEQSVVLIDEPENSLHPRWQREYLDLLLDALGYRNSSVFVATHSPLIVSAAASQSAGENWSQQVQTIVLTRDRSEERIEAPTNVEGLLAEVFNVVTPENHYLSQSLVKLMDEVDRDPSHMARAKRVVDRYRAAMPNEKQEKVLRAVEVLIEQIAEGK